MSDKYLERTELKESADSALKDNCGDEKLLSLTDAHGDMKEELWPFFAELGWLGLIIPE